MTRLNLLSCLLVGASLPVLAAQATPIEFKSDLEAATIVSAIDHDGLLTQDESLLYEVALDNRIETFLDNGLKISGRLTLRGQRDHPARPGFSGQFGTSVSAPSGAYSGVSSTVPGDETGARGSLEAAYLEFDGGYGELRLGRDRGVAARFHEGAPSALTFTGVSNVYLDPTGLSLARTNHDLTGPSAKLSYATPRILGLRAGISLTPDANAKGLDRNLSAFSEQPDIENAVELAANLSRTLRSANTSFEASLAWSTASVDSPFAGARGDVSTLSAGVNIEFSAFTIGGSWLSSDNGFKGADYEAWDIGVSKEIRGTDVSIGYSEADDALAGLSSEAFSISAARNITDDLTLGLSYQDQKLRSPAGKNSGSGIVVEITLRSDFLEMSAN